MVSTTDFIAAIEIGSSKRCPRNARAAKRVTGGIKVLAYAEEQLGSFNRKRTR